MPTSHLTTWLSRYFLIALLFSSAWVSAQTWPEAHLRGTPNNWTATAMTWNTTTGRWEAQLTFSDSNPRFKISRYADNWNEAYPAQDYLITQGDGDYRIVFDDATKAISLTKLAHTLSSSTICYNNPGNHASPTIYFWNPVPSGSVSPLPAWPGSSMTRRGNFFCYDFSVLLSNGVMPNTLGVIFSNNGGAQTNDLTYNGAGCYENGNWKSLQQCGFNVSGGSSSSSSITSSSIPSSSSSSYSANTHFATVTNSSGATESRLACYGAQAGAACDLRIYQVMVESFIDGDANANFNTGYGTSHHKGDLQGIINSLDYIASLGVNAIWLTPIFHSVPLAGQDDGANRLDATGYFASNYFAVDPRFGNEAQLRELIEVAHAKGMYVFLDGVFGHFKANANDYPSPSGRRVSTHGGPQGGTGRLSVYPNDLEFFKEVAAYWIANFKIDGWRLDQAYQVPASYWDDIRAVVEQTSSTVSYINAQGQRVNPLGYMVGEVWKGENDIANEAYGSPSATALKSAFDFPLRYKLVQTLAVEESGLGNSAASNLNVGFATHQAYPGHAMPNLMLGNHDLVRFGDLLQRGNIANPADAGYWQRHKAAFSFMTAFSGPITLYYGDEIGQELPNFSAAVNPCNGSSGLCDDHVSRTSGFVEGISTTLGSGVATLSQQQRELKNYVSELMNLRAAYPALSQGSRTHIFSNNHVYIDRKDKHGSRVLYVLNTKGVPAVVDIAATAIDATQPLVDLQNPLQGYENIAGNYRLELEPFEALFLSISNGSSSSPAQSSSSSSVASHSSVPASSVSSVASSSTATQATGIYFHNSRGFTTPYIHFFNLLPAAENSSWPGLAMQNLGDGWYRHDLSAAVTQGCVVFSNHGAPQTPNLCFTAPNTCYRDNQWQTPEACGLPSGLTANAGVDRKANVGTRQVLSAAASVGDYATVSWTSPAWSGALTGEQVVTPVLNSIGSYPITLTLTTADNQSATDTLSIEVVAAAQGLPERPQLAAPLGFPVTGSVGAGNYRFVQAFPALEGAFPSPVQIANDGINDLIYVVDKRGTLHVFPNRDDVATTEVRTLLDIRNQVRDFHEAGLLSVAFDPDYASNGFFYIYYIHGTNDNEKNADGSYGDSVLERWTVNDPLHPTGVVANSRAELLRVPQPGPDHKGGMMQFHPTEGYLYLGIGDGAYGHSAITSYPQDPRTNNSAQQTDNLRGTFIRIKPLAEPVNGKYYEVPADNPFVGIEGFRPEIWSYGHRNPWRWSFDSQAPHTLWETEVGQQGFEEVNLIEKGKNYGWPICEGTTNRGDLGGDPARNCTTDFEPPREGYGRSQGVSIIGGIVYHGSSLPALQGKFIFGDYVSKRIWSMTDGEAAKEVVSEVFPGNIASFGTDIAGESVLVTTYQTEYGGLASIYKMLDDNSDAAQIPATLSATGLFADLTNLIPAHGVIEYGVNMQGWFDGAATRHFIALPNDADIGFDPTAVWDLPVGTVLVKHLSVEAANNPAKAFTTAVLFRQESGWQAANYRWNAAGTDAELVKESVTVADGSLYNRQRIVQTGADCGSCHQGVGSKNPLGLHTRQLNGDFDYHGVADNQLELFNSIGLFTDGISNAASYEAFAELDGADSDQTARVKAYLHTNCAHCHASSFMDMRYDTPLTQMRLINEGGSGATKRVFPGDHSNSLVHIYQTTDGNRMPKGSFYTNPVADLEFAQWIDGLTVSNASSSSSSSSSSAASITGIAIAPETIVLSSSQQLVAYGLREDGSRTNLFGQVSWRMASGSDVASVSAGGLLTRLEAGAAVVEARYQDLTSTLTIEGATPGVHLRFENTGNWTNVRAYLWTVVNGANREVVPWPGTAMTGPDADGYWTIAVAPEYLNNGSINVVFNNGNGTQTDDYTRSESSSFNAGTKVWTSWNPDGPANSTLYRLSVMGGSTPDDARDFPAGTVVTVTADEAPYGTTFSGWTGDGLPYVFSDPAEPVVKLVVPAHGVALQALFEGDSHGAARAQFTGQCASCHGTNGTGGMAKALDDLHQSSAWTVELLAQYINDYMPMDNSAQCSGMQPGGCAYDIASMIMADAWAAPSCEGSACETGVSLDARNLRLLTREEYLNTVRDIFGLNFAADVLSPVPADGTVRNYDTASSLTLNDDRTLGYQMVAEDIADLIITSTGFMGMVSGCDDVTCVVTNLGRKLFRRPLTTVEVTRYVDLYQDADGGRGVLQALLISPKFMYRSEMGVQDVESGLYRLSNYEIATLLSYTFWVTAPDELLLDAAAGNDFTIQAQVERLLADPRAERGLRRFAKGWLINNKYGFNAISDSTLVERFKEETIRFVMESIKDNVPVNTILTANYTYADQQLAQYYGLASVPPANTWQKVFHAAGDLRTGTGVLGHGSFLASRASSRPAPIQRGVFVREVLMCQEFPPPAAANFDVKFEPSDTNRDATSRHTSDPGCKACHQYIDGVGFGFERLGSDALLRATETLGNGTVVDVIGTGVMKSLNSPETTLDPNSPEIPYSTVAELAELIAESGQAEACYSRQFYRYVVGRNEVEGDEPIIRSYSADVRGGGGMRDMLIDLTLNDSFIMRR